MLNQELSSINAEADQVRSLLDGLDSADFLNRMSLETRLEHLTSLANELHQTVQRPVTTSRILFKGEPVLGTRGIVADFATKAMGAFSDSLTAVAASLNISLPPMGPIPNRQDHQIMITGVARGSFGFQIEEYCNGNQLDLGCESSIGKAMELTSNLIESSISNDDDQLSEAASEIDHRALIKIRSFMKIVCDHNAMFSLKTGSKNINLTSVNQVQRALERLSEDNIQESTKTFRVIFFGSMPQRRTFEFKMIDQDEWLYGKIDSSLEVSDLINKNIHKPASSVLHTTKVGNGKVKYRLVGIPEWD